MKIAYYRGTLVAKMTNSSSNKGAMLSAGLSEAQIQPYLRKVSIQSSQYGLNVSCINSPKNVTVSGDLADVDTLKATLDDDNIFTRKLKVNVPYHSPRMNEIASEYRNCIENLSTGDFVLKYATMVSSVTGNKIPKHDLCQSDYWVKNLVSPVRFFEALGHMCSHSTKALRNKLDGSHRDIIMVDDLLELGPHSALQGPVRDILKEINRTGQIRYQSALIRPRPALETMLEACGRLYCQGHSVNTSRINRPNGKQSPRPAVISNLPEYPFDRSKTYWHESRLSKGLRFRRHPHNPLLGTPVADWNPLEGKWRHLLKVSELPWIEDHKVCIPLLLCLLLTNSSQINGSTLYPAAGMAVMAIEAARQMAEDRKIIAFDIKNATFHTPLTLSSSSNGVETQFFLRPLRDTSDKNNQWSDFRLCIYEDGEWVETCRGTIQVIYEADCTEVDNGRETREELQTLRIAHDNAAISCNKTVDPQFIYQRLHRFGYHYGPRFKPISSLQYNEKGEVLADVNLSHPSIPTTEHFMQPHVIHPTTFDGMLQLALAALTRGGTECIPTRIPTRISRLWVSSSGLNSSFDVSVRAYAETKLKGYRGTESSISVLSKTRQDLRLRIEGFETTAIVDSECDFQTKSSFRQLCCRLESKPDIDLLNEKEISNYCNNIKAPESDPISFFQDIATLKSMFATEALKSIDSKGFELPAPHLQRYVTWLRLQQDSFLADGLPRAFSDLKSAPLNPGHQEVLCKSIEKANKQGELVVRIGRSLSEILHGQVDALGLIFEDDLRKGYFQEVNQKASGFRKLGRYLDIYAHKHPGMKILEVGAGTGATTRTILETLILHEDQEICTPRYSQYDFTEISTSLLKEAQDSFQHQKRMNFKVLNVEEDPLNQNFGAGFYDMIVAAHVSFHHETIVSRERFYSSENLSRFKRLNSSLFFISSNDKGRSYTNPIDIGALLYEKPQSNSPEPPQALKAVSRSNSIARETKLITSSGGKLVLVEVTRPDILGIGFTFGILPGWWIGMSTNNLT